MYRFHLKNEPSDTNRTSVTLNAYEDSINLDVSAVLGELVILPLSARTIWASGPFFRGRCYRLVKGNRLPVLVVEGLTVKHAKMSMSLSVRVELRDRKSACKQGQHFTEVATSIIQLAFQTTVTESPHKLQALSNLVGQRRCYSPCPLLPYCTYSRGLPLRRRGEENPQILSRSSPFAGSTKDIFLTPRTHTNALHESTSTTVNF